MTDTATKAGLRATASAQCVTAAEAMTERDRLALELGCLRAERDTLAIERDAFRLAARRTREVEVPGTDTPSMAGTEWLPRTDDVRAWERFVALAGSVCVMVVYRTERGWYAGWTLNGSPRGPVDTFSGQVHRIGLRSACGYDLIVRCDQWATQTGGNP